MEIYKGMTARQIDMQNLIDVDAMVQDYSSTIKDRLDFRVVDNRKAFQLAFDRHHNIATGEVK